MSIDDLLFDAAGVAYAVGAIYAGLLSRNVAKFGRPWVRGYQLICFALCLLCLRILFVIGFDVVRHEMEAPWFIRFLCYGGLQIFAAILFFFGLRDLYWKVEKHIKSLSASNMTRLRELAEKVLS